MFVIAIRRFVRLDREAEFLKKYRAEKSTNPDFRGETLTKIVTDEMVPDSLRGLFQVRSDCHNYLNIARWEKWESFVGLCQMPPDSFDSDLEVAPRERIVLEVIEEVPAYKELPNS